MLRCTPAILAHHSHHFLCPNQTCIAFAGRKPSADRQLMQVLKGKQSSMRAGHLAKVLGLLWV